MNYDILFKSDWINRLARGANNIHRRDIVRSPNYYYTSLEYKDVGVTSTYSLCFYINRYYIGLPLILQIINYLFIYIYI